MSCTNQDRGHISFTKTGYQKVLTAFRKEYNAYIDKVVAYSHEVHGKLKAIKGTQARKDAFSQYFTVTDNFKFNSRIQCVNDSLYWAIYQEMFRGKNATLTKPRRSEFQKLTNKDRSFSCDHTEAYITFKDAETVTCGVKIVNGKSEPMTTDVGPHISWKTEEGNHSVEYARNDNASRILLAVLKKHAWKRGEGGVFYYDDEYEREGAGFGAYTSSISETFGPVGEKTKADQFKDLR
jgi:hypothetical protein